MPSASHRVALAILAGGQARRLGGVPKGQIRVDGRPIVERLLSMADLFDDVFWVGADRPWSGIRTVPDAVRERGAPGGVHAALAAAGTPWIVAVAWDMPFVSRRVIQRLLAERGPGRDAVCFEAEGRLQPLPGLYRPAAAAKWALALVREPSFAQIFRELRATVLPEAELRALDPEARSVVSLNSPEDLERWGGELPAARRD
jgi:molybdopterin-guanine dinucleotide biosynthesis protein A